MTKITPVILSGGSGTRLWPMSRTLYPKQLQPLYSDNSMLVETVGRVSGDDFADPIVICNVEHRFIIAEQLAKAGSPVQDIVLEPEGRSTAPAAAVAALMLMKRDPDALMLLMPSDHLIAKPDQFINACRIAKTATDHNALVTFGVLPAAPVTDFGYIRQGEALDPVDGCYRVEKFVEKPDLATAERYVNDGRYFWNSGIVLFRAKDYLDELSKTSPEMLKHCRQAVERAQRDMDFFRLDPASFHEIEGDSIDYAVMEKTHNAVIVPVDMGWNDVGSWAALWGVGDQDQSGNVVIGDVLTQGVTNSYVRSSGQLVVGIGLQDSIVVAMDDAVLVASKEHAHDVKNIVDVLKSDGRSEHAIHRQVYRPWGWYRSMGENGHFQVKLLSIHPGGILSLQSHKHRSEHWVVVSGVASVVRGDEDITLHVNESTYIPAGVRHRLENKGDELLHIIEVQTGDYLGEDDIERFEDVYGRS